MVNRVPTEPKAFFKDGHPNKNKAITTRWDQFLIQKSTYYIKHCYKLIHTSALLSCFIIGNNWSSV